MVTGRSSSGARLSGREDMPASLRKGTGSAGQRLSKAVQCHASAVPAPCQDVPAARAGTASAPLHRGAMTNQSDGYAIEAEGLVKRFGTTTALAGIDLAARPGTVLG